MTVLFKGIIVTLMGAFVTPGTEAPDFKLVKNDLSEYTLKDDKGKPIYVIGVTDNTKVLCVSKDLPFAQSRFCTVEGIENVVPLSDFRNTSSFGEKYGVLMKDGPLQGLLARAVVVINPQGEVVYSELVPEITQEPDYDAVLKVIPKA